MNVIRRLYEEQPASPLESEEYRKALDAVCMAEKRLLEAYPELRELLSAYQSAQLGLFSHTSYQEFRNGFLTGAQMMLEVLEK